MEKLKQYLTKRKHKDFAEQIGISPAFLSQILSGRRKPGGPVIVAIEDATKNAVVLRDWHAPQTTGDVIK